MAIDYDHLMALESTGNVVRYGDREAMLYALSIGMGRDPLNTNELDFVFEKNPLKTIPTTAMTNYVKWSTITFHMLKKRWGLICPLRLFLNLI